MVPMSEEAPGLLGMFGPLLLFCLVAYVYFAACLMVIANYSVFLPSIHDRLWPGDRATAPWRETTTEEADEHVRNRG